jgi:hypothetical protein
VILKVRSGRFSGTFRSFVWGGCQLRRVNILSLDLDGKSSRTWTIGRMMREETGKAWEDSFVKKIPGWTEDG